VTEPTSPTLFSDSAGFPEGKEPGALRTIGEVASALGIRPHVLRYWEEQFPMLRPLKRSGGRRYYRPDDIALVARINRLVHREGYTLRGARLALQGKGGTGRSGERMDAGAPAAGPIATPVLAMRSEASEADDLVARLDAIRARLATALG